MSNTEILKVWYESQLVGEIQRDITGHMGFTYEESWCNKGFTISQRMPLSTKIFPSSGQDAHRFFANLLPEAGARAHIIRDLKIVNDDFELLKAIGGECAGALSILPAHIAYQPDFNYILLDDDSFRKLLLRKGSTINFTTDIMRPRLSLAGAQDKCAVLFDKGQYFLPEKCAPSTHILKFEVPDYKNIPAYEYFLAKLAESIGMLVVACDFKRYEQQQFLLITRYDRIKKLDNSIERLHQEDFCQALGMGYEKKYQLDGGPSFYDCYILIQNVSVNPILDSENLIKWQIFNVLCGNSDGHAKNLALLYNKQHRAVLAPFYDLVCTRAIERIDANLAMSVGGEFNPDNIQLMHWQRMAKECNIREQYLKKILQKTAQSLLNQLDQVKKRFGLDHGKYPAIQRVEYIIKKQCNRLLAQIVAS
jgi:serine/threonine-protein kinase HipA